MKSKIKLGPSERLQKQIAKYLITKGWKPIVIGEIVIQSWQRWPDGHQGTFELNVKFAGSKPSSKTAGGK